MFVDNEAMNEAMNEEEDEDCCSIVLVEEESQLQSQPQPQPKSPIQIKIDKLVDEAIHMLSIDDNEFIISKLSDGTICQVVVKNGIAHVYRALPLIMSDDEGLIYELLEPRDRWHFIGSREL